MKEIIQENRLIEELSEYSIRWLNVPWLNLNENTRYTHRPAVIIKEGSDFFAVRISSIKTISGNRLIDENEPMRPLRDDYEFELENWEELGLECPSYVVCDYIRRIIGITRTEFVSILPRDQIKTMQTKINNFKKDKNKNIREFESWLLYKSPFDNKYSGKMIGANLDLLNTRNNCNYLDVCTMLDSVITKSNHNEENIIICSKFYNKDNKPKFHFYSLIINYNGINSFRIILPKNRDSLANSTVFKLDTDDLNKAIQIENEWVMENFNFRNDLETISYILTEEDKDYIKNNDTSKILKYFKEKEIFSNNNVLESSVTMRKPNEYEQKRLDIINEQMKYIYEEAKYIEKKITYGDIVKDIEWFYYGEVPNGAYKIDGQYYRVRVETIVKREINGTPHVFFEKKDKPTHYGTMYKLPGGSVEPNKNLQEQAESEVNEEILCKVKNIRYTGKHYIVKYDPKDIPEWHKRILWPMGLKYVGAITFVFTAEYNGPYRKKVEDVDKDSLAQKGNWYPIWDFEELKSDVHQGITLEAMEVVEESLMNKKNIIPVDLSEYKDFETRLLCMNTHILNTIIASAPFLLLPVISEVSLFQILGKLSVYGAWAISDQIFAVDIFDIDKNGKIKNKIEGLPILATNNGIVVDVTDGRKNEMSDIEKLVKKYGNFVIISHDNNKYYSLYAHIKSGTISVKVGDKVHRGQKIGEIGHSGNSDAKQSHLHFEMTYTNIMSKNHPSPLFEIPKTLTNFENYYFTEFSHIENLKSLLNIDYYKKYYNKPMKLNTSGELHGCCFLTDPPDKSVTEMLEVIEESTKEFKNSKVKNFEEFCKECKTPEDALNWFIAQKVVWTERANEENFRWPDQLIKERKGNCFDQSVFMHFFFEKKHIEHRMALFTIRTENGKQAGHIFPLYRKGKYIYAWLYIGPGMGIISGPYKDYDEAAERVTDFYKVLLLSGKKQFNSPISDETEWSVQDYEETKHFDEYLNKSIKQRDYMNDRGGDNLWSTHFCSKDFYFIRIPKINAIMAKLMYLTKEKMKNKEKVNEALEVVNEKWSGLKNNISKLTESVEEPSDNMVTNSGIVDYVLNYMRDSIDIANFSSLKSGKRFMYTKCTVMKKDIPLVLFASYCEGLTTVLKKAEVEFYFSDTRPRLSGVESAYSGIIPFADGFLVYKKFPLENSLLMNGFALVDTKGINYAETDTKDVYVNMFEILFGMRKLANALDNFYDWFIDPVTFTVLEDLNYPTDFVGLLLAGNKLLADNNFTDELDMRNYRIRNNEIAYAYAFKQIADAYSRFRMTSNNKNPEKISIPQGVVLKDIMQSQVVDDVSELSPIVEAEKARAITTKGKKMGLYIRNYVTIIS